MIESTLRATYTDLFYFIDRQECGLGYAPRFREFHISVRSRSSIVQRILFCPFSGQPLPQSLRDVYFDELDKIGLVDGLSDIPRAPEEFQSESWWLARGL